MKHDEFTPAFDRQAGRSDTLGATFDGEGTNFAIWSHSATRVELCLYDPTGQDQIARLDLPDADGGIWYGYLPGVGAGQAYGYRVHGPFAPEDGHRFNPAKLLLDPYAMQTVGDLIWDDALFGYPIGGSDLDRDDRDSAPFMPKAVVADPDFDWDEDRALRTPWSDTLIYEGHVKGLTMRHPDVPEVARGTFEGLGQPAMIDHLKAIGVTAVELLPVHGFVNDRHLQDKGLSNYWGYNSISFFAPHRPYLRSGKVAEMKAAVRRFHKAGIEVLLDVVYNHTAEGNELGPTLSFRGIDNANYYLSSPDAPRHGFDVTGTGNSLNVSHPMVLRLVLDSLRYWVEALHVDGFRFDLAPTLAREETGFEREGAFIAAVRQDPVLRGVKLIAEPWDIGEGGYQVGAFPWPFREWNDKFRDDVRAYWRRDAGLKSAVADRLLGSPVQFDHDLRPATSSINLLAAHDGFTLADTVAYADKHNEANGEGGADGHSNNLSDNCGIEGETEDAGVLATRRRRRRSMLATLFLSQGVPMLLAGDEFGQTQQGNNNAYCQDNELTWLNWAGADTDMIAFVGALARLRADMGLARDRFVGSHDGPAVAWLSPEGGPSDEASWQNDGIPIMMTLDADNGRILMIFNAGDAREVVLPDGSWRARIDTSQGGMAKEATVEGHLSVDWQSVVVLTEARSNA